MILNIILINSKATWLELIILIIPVIIIFIGSGFIFKWYDKKPVNGSELRKNSDKKLSKILIDTTAHETHFRLIKEIFNQIIHQRSLVSRIKIEVQGFEEMIKAKHNFYESDYKILDARLTDLDNLINDLKQLKEMDYSGFNEFTSQILTKDNEILGSVRSLSVEIIQVAQNQNYEKYIELMNSIERNNQDLIELYQKLTQHIHKDFE